MADLVELIKSIRIRLPQLLFGRQGLAWWEREATGNSMLQSIAIA